MKRFITILTACCCALAVTLPAAEQPDQPDAKKDSKKPKNVQKQQVSPKQVQPQPQQLKTNTHVQNNQTRHNNKPVTNTTTTNTVPKHNNARYMAPPPKNLSVSPSTNVQSNKVHKQQLPNVNQPNQQLQTNTQQQFQKHKLNQQQVQTIRAQHHNFRAVQNTSVNSVRFNQNYRITNAQNWSGPRYNVFRTYHPQWHDQGWWRSHHNHLTLIAGGWYYFNAGYWYPAWGYNEAESYYPYDGPIYSGPSARPADQVVADVQAALQEQGYYKGQVDGLLGPLTRQALAEYQTAAGLYATETIDEPTLESLGLS